LNDDEDNKMDDVESGASTAKRRKDLPGGGLSIRYLDFVDDVRNGRIINEIPDDIVYKNKLIARSFS
jgi:hypothetical protein